MWLHIPESYLSRPEWLVLTSVSDSPAHRLASSATSSGKHMRPAYWSHVWRTERWIRHLSTLTCDPSTLALGVDAWISSLVVTPVSRSASQESVQARTTSDTSGLTSLESSASSSRPPASSRTSPVICRSADVKSSESFNAWASRLRRHCSVRKKSALRTSGTDFSSLLPTPTASTYGSSNNGFRDREKGETFALAGKPSLATMAARSAMPTLTASDASASRRHGYMITGHAGTTIHDWLDSMRSPEEVQCGERPSLNPAFAEWMMGLPIGWTDCEPLETPLSLCRPPEHSSSSQKL
jgi:hypothetical protein